MIKTRREYKLEIRLYSASGQDPLFCFLLSVLSSHRNLVTHVHVALYDIKKSALLICVRSYLFTLIHCLNCEDQVTVKKKP